MDANIFLLCLIAALLFVGFFLVTFFQFGEGGNLKGNLEFFIIIVVSLSVVSLGLAVGLYFGVRYFLSS